MSEAGDLKSEFDKTHESYERLAQVVEEALRKHLDQDQVKVHTVTSRAKEWTSFERKASDKMKSDDWTHPLEDCVDRAGVRVVCLYREDMARIEETIRRKLQVVSVDKKDKEPDRFGYRGWHFVVCIPEDWAGPEYEGLHDLKCEIQVRTILMHAWDSVSHHIDYKTDAAIPEELRKDFYALSGVLHVADTHFEMLRREQQQRAADMLKHAKTGELPLSAPLDHDTLAACLQARFPDRDPGSVESRTQFLKLLHETDYETLDDVETAINGAEGAFEEYEESYPPMDAVRYSQVGTASAALSLANPEFREAKMRDWDFLDRETREERYVTIATKHGLPATAGIQSRDD